MRRTLATRDELLEVGQDLGMGLPHDGHDGGARVGEPETAIDALLMDVPKNRYLANGHNHQDDRLPIYLPGNGGLLAVDRDDGRGLGRRSERHAPGFPDNGKWQVKWEGLQKMP